MRTFVKRTAQAIFAAALFPAVLLCGFGSLFPMYLLFAHTLALLPGFIGEYCRAAFYRFTLRDCSPDIVIGFGTFFSRREVSVGKNVSIGAYCIVGCTRVGDWTQISSHVEIPGGRYQHTRDDEGRLTSEAVDSEVVVGSHCWVGASAIVMANVGSCSTIGAGSVVVKDIPENAVAVGNPAKVIRPPAGQNAE